MMGTKGNNQLIETNYCRIYLPRGVIMKIYLDVCCLNRPLDDHTQDRIRLESEAVLTILSHVSDKKWQMIGSDVIDYEISKTPDPDRRNKVEILANLAIKRISLKENLVSRAKAIQGYNIKSFDALHLACAEEENVDIFLTTDQELVNKCVTLHEKIKVKVMNPLNWIMEVFY